MVTSSNNRFSLQRGGTGKGKSKLGPVLTSSDRGFSKIPAYGFGMDAAEPPYRVSPRIRWVRLTRLDAMICGPLVLFLALLAAFIALLNSIGLMK